MTTLLRISFILFDVLAMVGDNYKGVLVCSSVYITSHDYRSLKGLRVLVESRIVICVMMSPHFAQLTRGYPGSQPILTLYISTYQVLAMVSPIIAVCQILDLLCLN